MKRKNVLMLVVLWLLVLVSIVASVVTLLASDASFGFSRLVSREEYDMIDRYSRLEEIRKQLSEGYFQEVNDEELITGAIRGMMASVDDPYTFYYTPEEMQKHQNETVGEYSGLGLLIQNNEDAQIEVIRVYTDGPADIAGIQAGDCIVSVNGASVYGDSSQSLNEAVTLMQGKNGSEVTIAVLRDGKTMEFQIVRGDVHVSNVAWQLLDGNIGYISIFQFTGDDVNAFETVLEELQQQDAQGLVIDLRNNPGGILDDVVAIADKVLPEGVIVYTKDRDGSRADFYSDASHIDLPICVLINDMSASASEIFAAAVQDYDRGTIVGEKSYGKGVVQSVIRFDSDGAGMQYTSSSYFTPSGKSIHGVGVTPDILVAESEGYVPNSGIADLENDIQLQVAIETLQKEIKEDN